jgi:L-amino acid N-acyltransferase
MHPLVLSRMRDESVMIGDDVQVTVLDIRGDKVRLSITAPKETSVHRKEVYEAIRQVGGKLKASDPAEQLRLSKVLYDPQHVAAVQATRAQAAIRPASLDDLITINDIYNWYVPRSTCTYQEEDETIESRREWLDHKRAKGFPVTVAEVDGQIVGWGSLGTYRERSAYRFTVENSVYVRHDMHGRGIGSALLADQIARGKACGYKTIIAGIDAEQSASVKLHAKFGFTDAGRQKEVGFKFGRWLDVVFMQLML